MCLRLLSIVLTLLLALLMPSVQAQMQPDSLMMRLGKHLHASQTSEIGQLVLESYNLGVSHLDKPGFASRHFPHLLPFQGSQKRDAAFEAIVQTRYHWPGDLRFNCSTINATSRRKGRQMLKDYFSTILPGIQIRQFGDDTSGHFHVLPYSEEGLEKYEYAFIELTDSLRQDLEQHNLLLDSNSCLISFHPRRHHHTMLDGVLVIDSVQLDILALRCKGRIDLATIESNILFHKDSVTHTQAPYLSKTDIHYRYWGTRATNKFTALYHLQKYQSLDSLKSQPRHLDLTSTYQTRSMTEADFDTIRPLLLSAQTDSLLYPLVQDTAKTTAKKRKNPALTFSEFLVEGSHFGDDDNAFRLYGPLDPATFEYDNLNGFSLNERARWNIIFDNQSTLKFSGRIGYAFKLRELQWRAAVDWSFLPRIRQGIELSFSRSNTGFSSKQIEMVNDAIRKNKDSINFYDLGLDYFQLYELRAEHHTELCTGLNLFTGLQYNYRNPVKHGVQAISPEHQEKYVGQHFCDFAPYLRLEWTPCQYFYYEDKRKIYIDTPYPTFILEGTHAIPGVWGANSNYSRLEFDVQQNIRIHHTQLFAYRFGAGGFYNQKGEYFVNYHYFRRRFYPSTWMDNHVGGIFQLLEEYWFSSSPHYIRAHAMYETPFGLFNHIRPLSRFVIKERAYVNLLYAGDKPFYSEFGYAVANNYINVGVFVGFTGTDYYKFGFKFRFELERHF